MRVIVQLFIYACVRVTVCDAAPHHRNRGASRGRGHVRSLRLRALGCGALAARLLRGRALGYHSKSFVGQRHRQAAQLREDRLLAAEGQADDLVGLGRDVRRRAMGQTHLRLGVALGLGLGLG